MKKVFLYAYDHVNLGDDLFIETIVKRYPNVMFYLWSRKENEKVFQGLNNLKIIDENVGMLKKMGSIHPGFVRRYKSNLQKKCHAHVYIGGSIFMEYPTWKDIVNWWEYQSSHYAFYVLGANFGPYQTEDYKTAMGNVFSKLEDVCFRDTYSKGLFYENRKVRQAPDILFSYPMPEVHKMKKQIFFSITKYKKVDGSQQSESIYEMKISEIAEEYAKEGYDVVLASFCEEEGDLEAADAIRKKVSKEYRDKIRCFAYDGINRQVFLQELACSEYVIATRFHGVILAGVAGRPVYPILYSDKTKHVLEDLKFEGNYADIRTLEGLSYHDTRRNLERHITLSMEGLVQAAEEHFAKLDERLR